MRRLISIVLLGAMLALVISDAGFHFDKERVQAKRQHQSAQRHWSAFYLQAYTYDDGPFRYRHDIENIRDYLEPDKVLLSDKATSYYLAAQLPVFVRNVHGHHHRNSEWNRIIGARSFCYIDQAEHLANVKDFINSEELKAENESQPEFKYWVINRDSNNLNLRYDCLSARRGGIVAGLNDLAEPIYKGDYLWLYQLH